MSESEQTYATTNELTEATIQYNIIEMLLMMGFMVLRVNSGRSRDNVPFIRWSCDGAWSTSGVSDILAFRDGMFIAVEVKRPGNHPSNDQCEFIRAVIQHGGQALVASNVEAALEIINGGALPEDCGLEAIG